MGRFADAVLSHRKHLVYSKEGVSIIVREDAKMALAVDFQNMLNAIDDPFDDADEKLISE